MANWYKANDHRYCAKCGTATVTGKEWIDRYDEFTGTPIMRHYIFCPNKTFFSSGHFKEEFEGEDMIIERYY